MDEQQLRREFEALSAKSVACDEAYAHSKQSVYEVLVEAYLYYRKARDVPNHLEKIYKEAGIEGYKTGNQENFRPFIRAQFRLDIPNFTDAEKKRQNLTPGSQKNRVADYAAVMSELDNEWMRHPTDFAFKPFNKLLDYITKNGLSGLIAAAKEEKAKAKGKNQSDDLADVELTRRHLAQNALATIKQSKQKIGSATITKAEQVHFNPDGLTACICRYNPITKAYEIVATSSDEQAIQSIAAGDTARIDSISTAALQTLAEVVSTQSFPSRFIPAGDRSKLTGALKGWYNSVYLENSKIEVVKKTKDGKIQKQKAKANRRLVLRGKDIILSAQRTEAGVITILKPTHKLVPKITDEYYMKTQHLRTIEEWIENKTIAARVSKPTSVLGKADPATKADFMLEVENTATGSKVERLFFYDVHRTANNPNSAGQVEFQTQSFSPTWTFKVSKAWVLGLRQRTLENWFENAASGRKIKRIENAVFDLSISNHRLTVGWEIDDTDTFPSDTYSLPSSLKPTTTKSHKLMLSSKELAPVLYNLCDLSIKGDIKFAGSASTMTISFSTKMGDYTIAFPAITRANNKLKRDKSDFGSYAAKGKGNAKH